MIATSAAISGALLRLLLLACIVLAGCSNKLAVNYPAPEAADGWSYQLVANNFSKPRSILFDNNGGLLVVDRGVGIVHLKLKDEGNTCVSVDKKTTLLESHELTHSIVLSPDGKTLYASSAVSVYEWSYDSKAVKLSDSNRTVITGMNSTGHVSRTLFLSKKKPRTLLVSRGSDSNKDEDTQDVNSGRSQIRSFNLDRLDNGSDAKPFDYLDGHVVGWGLRNSVGIAEDPSGGLWSVENSADWLHRRGQDIHSDNPAEELNYHGRIDDLNDDDDKPQGANHGYPLCYTVWNTDKFPELGELVTGAQFADDDLHGDNVNASAASNVTDAVCNDEFKAPRLAFQAHTAPLDIEFDADGANAYISFHGSWNRQQPVGYRIARVAFDVAADKDDDNNNVAQPVAASNSTDAAVDVLATKDLSNCPDRCFRPVGLAWDSQHRLWFSSDATGEIFVMKHDTDRRSVAAELQSPGFAAVAAAVVAGSVAAVVFFFS